MRIFEVRKIELSWRKVVKWVRVLKKQKRNRKELGGVK